MAMFGRDALGVELEAVNRRMFGAHGHDDAVFAPGVGDQWRGGRSDRERMIAGGGEGRRQALEQAVMVVPDVGDLAVHRGDPPDRLSAS